MLDIAVPEVKLVGLNICLIGKYFDSSSTKILFLSLLFSGFVPLSTPEILSNSF